MQNLFATIPIALVMFFPSKNFKLKNLALSYSSCLPSFKSTQEISDKKSKSNTFVLFMCGDCRFIFSDGIMHFMQIHLI